ncbi:MAG: porin family protein [Ignavibacteria bacterium]|nr:porin family protein [Ignavibacteria bacterium]MBT8383665.1 porin family protein [Ignavibacteria bacterium]MBT8392317.1 porin family protein [Ignavibacteria bacterium]NNJ53757.1 outer membrane beta-barrel protein [Ignavibacteriaceae bacterium]NNL19822.1 outer membrane beta-barrel protein [Ignavibacteriaceae bacterium]
MRNNIIVKYSKLLIIFFTISLFIVSEGSAQIELFGFGGYMTYSSVPVREGNLSFEDGNNYGFGLDVGIDRGILVELNYTHNQTSARLRRFNGGDEPLFDMNTHYIQLGAQYEFRRNSKQKAFPYTLVTAGATLFDAKDATLSDEWRFSVAFGGGGKFFLGKNIGLRLQVRMLLPLTFSGGGLWCGTGGCSVGVGSWATLAQFDFTAAFFIRLGK